MGTLSLRRTSSGVGPRVGVFEGVTVAVLVAVGAAVAVAVSVGATVHVNVAVGARVDVAGAVSVNVTLGGSVAAGSRVTTSGELKLATSPASDVDGLTATPFAGCETQPLTTSIATRSASENFRACAYRNEMMSVGITGERIAESPGGVKSNTFPGSSGGIHASKDNKRRNTDAPSAQVLALRVHKEFQHKMI